VNPAARYGLEPVTVNPGPSGGHVWPPWTYNPATGLVYFPGTAGQPSTYTAAQEYDAEPTEIGLEGRGKMNMATSLGGGQLKGKGKQPELPDSVAAAAGKAPAPPKPVVLPAIGPDGPTGNVLYAWDPIARKERWRAAGGGAGPFSGGSLSTAGNLVFTSVNSNLIAYRADTGEKVLDLATGLSQTGPPVSYMVDGRQYIVVAGGPPQGAGRGGQANGKAGSAPPSRMLALVLDGAPLTPPAPAQ
jgi:quinohemoprotein ethanol dehydrogenase